MLLPVCLWFLWYYQVRSTWDCHSREKRKSHDGSLKFSISTVVDQLKNTVEWDATTSWSFITFAPAEVLFSIRIVNISFSSTLSPFLKLGHHPSWKTKTKLLTHTPHCFKEIYHAEARCDSRGKAGKATQPFPYDFGILVLRCTSEALLSHQLLVERSIEYNEREIEYDERSIKYYDERSIKYYDERSGGDASYGPLQ
jgi:hypothetical protein